MYSIKTKCLPSSDNFQEDRASCNAACSSDRQSENSNEYHYTNSISPKVNFCCFRVYHFILYYIPWHIGYSS